MGSGAVYCQILDFMYPDKVPMQKVNFKAKTEYDFIQNFKILQQSFQKLNIKRHIEVEKLIKCRYQDNLEFIQWMKRFSDCNSNSNKEYDGASRRKGVDPDWGFAHKVVCPKTFDPNGNMIVNNPIAPKAERKRDSLPKVEMISKEERKEKENLKNDFNIQHGETIKQKKSEGSLQKPGKIPLAQSSNELHLKQELERAQAKLKAIGGVVFNL